MNSNKVPQAIKTTTQSNYENAPILPVTQPSQSLEVNLHEESLDRRYAPNIATNYGNQVVYSIGAKRPNTPGMHFALFGIFTILIFCYGFYTMDTGGSG